MHMKTEDITTATLSVFGLSVTLTDFRNWLDIVLIVLSIINISIILRLSRPTEPFLIRKTQSS